MVADVYLLEKHASDLASAAKTLAVYCQQSRPPSPDTSIPHSFVPSDAPCEVQQARQDILATVCRIQTLLTEPIDFIQRLAGQTEILACVQWLGEFQILACIPLSGSVPTRDVADLAGVPETHLLRVVRTMAAAGFLGEPQPGCVAHTALSAPFVIKPSYMDAVNKLRTKSGATEELGIESQALRNGVAEGKDFVVTQKQVRS